MNKIILKLSDINIEKFLKRYESDLKFIYKSLKDEKLIDLIDIVNLNDFKIDNKIKKELDESDLIEVLKKEEYGLFLMVGGVCDENVTYFRFIDGIQYRIAPGECYEESCENFHDYKCEEKLIKTGEMEFSIECSYGIVLYIKEEKLNLIIVELVEDDYNNYNVRMINKSGDFGKITRKYIDTNINH